MHIQYIVNTHPRLYRWGKWWLNTWQAECTNTQSTHQQIIPKMCLTWSSSSWVQQAGIRYQRQTNKPSRSTHRAHLLLAGYHATRTLGLAAKLYVDIISSPRGRFHPQIIVLWWGPFTSCGVGQRSRKRNRSRRFLFVIIICGNVVFIVSCQKRGRRRKRLFGLWPSSCVAKVIVFYLWNRRSYLLDCFSAGHDRSKCELCCRFQPCNLIASLFGLNFVPNRLTLTHIYKYMDSRHIAVWRLWLLKCV